MDLGPVSELSNIALPAPLPVKKDIVGRYRSSAGPVGQRHNLVGRFDANGDGQFDPNHIRLWNNGILPYKVDPSFPKNVRRQINIGIRSLMEKTNITMFELPINVGTPYLYPYSQIRSSPYQRENNKEIIHKKSFVYFRFDPSKDGGSSPIGRNGNYNNIKLGPNISSKTVIHEILHSLGFYHEQARSDRNKFVEIKFENISMWDEHNFWKNRCDEYLVTEEYDYESIMHYGGKDFSTNGKHTIIDKRTGRGFERLQYKLSDLDIDGINSIYPIDASFGGDNPIRPSSSYKLNLKVLEMGVTGGSSDANLNPFSDAADDLFVKCRFGRGWTWRASSVRPIETSSRSIKRDDNQEAILTSTNNFGWNLKSNLIRKDAVHVKIYLSLYEDDSTSDDEWVDINPIPSMRDLPILIDMVSREIFLGDQNNLVHQDNYLGVIGEEIALQGFESTDEHELIGMIKFKIELEE